MDYFSESFEFIEQLLEEYDTFNGDKTGFIERWAHLLNDSWEDKD